MYTVTILYLGTLVKVVSVHAADALQACNIASMCHTTPPVSEKLAMCYEFAARKSEDSLSAKIHSSRFIPNLRNISQIYPK